MRNWFNGKITFDENATKHILSEIRDFNFIEFPFKESEISTIEMIGNVHQDNWDVDIYLVFRDENYYELDLFHESYDFYCIFNEEGAWNALQNEDVSPKNRIPFKKEFDLYNGKVYFNGEIGYHHHT